MKLNWFSSFGYGYLSEESNVTYIDNWSLKVTEDRRSNIPHYVFLEINLHAEFALLLAYPYIWNSQQLGYR